MSKCSATTASGCPCGFAAGENGLCPMHDPDRADERKAMGSKGGTNAQKKLRGEKREPRTDEARLRSSENFFVELERELKNSNTITDPAQRAKTVVMIVDSAARILKADFLESENRELKKLLVERHPELASHLKAVK